MTPLHFLDGFGGWVLDCLLLIVGVGLVAMAVGAWLADVLRRRKVSR